MVANGSVASAFAVAYGLTYFTPFALGYLGAIGTSAADTLATEIGLLNPYAPRLITNLNRQVPVRVHADVRLPDGGRVGGDPDA